MDRKANMEDLINKTYKDIEDAEKRKHEELFAIRKAQLDAVREEQEKFCIARDEAQKRENSIEESFAKASSVSAKAKELLKALHSGEIQLLEKIVTRNIPTIDNANAFYLTCDYSESDLAEIAKKEKFSFRVTSLFSSANAKNKEIKSKIILSDHTSRNYYLIITLLLTTFTNEIPFKVNEIYKLDLDTEDKERFTLTLQKEDQNGNG